MLSGAGLDGEPAQRAAGHSRHQDGRRPHGRAQLGAAPRPSPTPPPRRRFSPPHSQRALAWRRVGTWNWSGAEGQVIAQEVKALGRDMILGPDREHQPRAAMGPELRGLRRGPLPGRAHGRGVHQGRASRRRDPVGEAFRRQQRGVRAPPHRREDRRAHAARDLLAGVQGSRPGGGRVGRDVAYNKVNGLWCAENPLPAVRRRCRSAGASRASSSPTGAAPTAPQPPSAAGMDLEMPGGEAMRTWFAKPETQTGRKRGRLADRGQSAGGGRRRPVETGGRGRDARRILRVMFTAGLFDHATRGRRRSGHSGAEGGGAHGGHREHRAAEERRRRASAERREDSLGVAVIGPNAAMARTGGGGSSLVRPKYAISALDGIQEAAGAAGRGRLRAGRVPCKARTPARTRRSRAALAGGRRAGAQIRCRHGRCRLRPQARIGGFRPQHRWICRPARTS